MLIVLFAALWGCTEPPKPGIEPEDFALLWSEYEQTGEVLQHDPHQPLVLSTFGLAQIASAGTTTFVDSMSIPIYEQHACDNSGTGFVPAKEDTLARLESCFLVSHDGRTLTSEFEIDAARSLLWLLRTSIEIDTTTPYTVGVICYAEPRPVTICLASDVPWQAPATAEWHGEPVPVGYYSVAVNYNNGTVGSWVRTLPAPQ